MEVLSADSCRNPAEEQIVNSVLYIIRCLNAIHDRLRRIESQMDQQVAEMDEDYNP